ncbi:hypothetical protein CSUI_006537, partial [Cystoisospora suis]
MALNLKQISPPLSPSHPYILYTRKHPSNLLISFLVLLSLQLNPSDMD